MKVNELFEERIEHGSIYEAKLKFRSKEAEQSFNASSEEWKAGYLDYMNGKVWKWPTSNLKSKAGKRYRDGWDEAERAALRKKEIAAERKAAKAKA